MTDRIVDKDIVEKYNLKLEKGIDEIVGEIDKIVFRNIEKIPWSMGGNITGDLEFYVKGRCFKTSSESGFPNHVQLLHGDDDKMYFVDVAGYQLASLYDESRELVEQI